MVCNLADPPVIPTHQLPLLSRRAFSSALIPNRTSDALNESEWNENLVFDVQVIPYEVDLSWIEPALIEIKNLLETKKVN